MAKKSMIQREIKRQKLYNKYNQNRSTIKQDLKQADDFNEQINIQKKLQMLPRNSLKCRLRRRCWVTGRSRGFYRDFGLSRHILREMSHECLLPGIKKSSW